jgi:hypothetical protein
MSHRGQAVRDLPHAKIQESRFAHKLHRSLDPHRSAGSAATELILGGELSHKHL